MKEPSGQIIDRFVKMHLHSLLKERSFSKKSRTWNRKADAFTHVINVQADRWNQPGAAGFTLNIGIFSPMIHEICWGKAPPRFVAETDCMVRRRLGALVAGGSLHPKERDQWWELKDGVDPSRVGEEVKNAILTRAIPFLDKFPTLRSILDFLIDCEGSAEDVPITRVYTAIAATKLGDLDRAERILRDLSKTPYLCKRVLEVASRLGLPIDDDSKRTS